MVARVMIGALGGGAHGLRVSKPGFDVTNPGTVDRKLSFDSNWAKSVRVLARGTHVNAGTVNFAAQPVVPVALVQLKFDGFPSYAPQSSVSFGGWNNQPMANQSWYVKVGLSSIQFIFSGVTYKYLILVVS
jgi:hypothetical protein